MSDLNPQQFVLNLFNTFLTSENISKSAEEMSPDELKKVMELFNRSVQKYHLLGNLVIELNLGNSSGDIDFKTYSLEEFVHKAGKFEEATELYITRKDAESRIWIFMTAILLIAVVIVWMV